MPLSKPESDRPGPFEKIKAICSPSIDLIEEIFALMDV